MFIKLFQTNKSYTFNIVDEIVEQYKLLSKEGISSNIEIYTLICEKRYRVQGRTSIRADVNKREILDYIHEKNIDNTAIELGSFISLIISKEKFGLHLQPETRQNIRERLAFHKII